MGLKKFTWDLKPQMNIEYAPRVRVVKLGDGYEQRQQDGINNNLKKYAVSLNTFQHIADKVNAFLTEHGGVTPFLWQPPKSTQEIKVICRDWSVSVKYTTQEISATFEEVIA